MGRSSSANLRSRQPQQAARRLEMINVSKLRPHPKNPRVHSKAQILALAKCISAHGFNAPILTDREDRILAGHARLEAAKMLGLKEVPCIRLEHLSEAQATAYLLADNQLALRSTWDEKDLASALKELTETALNFDIETTGFEAPQIDFLVQSLARPEMINSDQLEALEGPATAQLGDLWILGSHRLFCGDARDPNAWRQLMEGKKASAAFADPPYNVKISGHAIGKGRKKHREFPMASGEMNDEEFGLFYPSRWKT